MSLNIVRMPGAKEAPKSSRASMETIVVTIKTLDSWKRPPFQREIRITPRVWEVVEDIKKTEVIPGILTLGKMDGDVFLIDGQHRIEAFRLSEMLEALADIRVHQFDSMEEMSKEFSNLNSPLVRMKNDDNMRAYEFSNPHIAAIRKRCPFVGYDRIRQATEGHRAKTLVSMANVVRLWFGSDGDTPTMGPSSTEAVKLLNEEQVALMTDFLSACLEAWGYDKENWRLWTSINIGLLAWLWRRAVLGTHLPQHQRGGVKNVRLTREDWVKCLMGLSADSRYHEWLVGRGLRDRDRSPAYSKIKDAFAKRLAEMGVKSPRFPQGVWVS